MSSSPPPANHDSPRPSAAVCPDCGHSILEDHNETFGCHNRDADDFGCTCTRKASEIINALAARVVELEAAQRNASNMIVKLGKLLERANKHIDPFEYGSLSNDIALTLPEAVSTLKALSGAK
jgi:hypothetical protein